MVPRAGGHAENEITVLRLTAGDACVRLLRDDPGCSALLLERLGPSLHGLGLPLRQRLEILCTVAQRVWRPAPGCGLPTGAAKGRWLSDREDPVDLLDGDPWARARWLASRTGLDATAIWEWGVVERVATGLVATRIGLQPVAREMLAAADHVARLS